MSELPSEVPAGTDRSRVPRPPRHPTERPTRKRTAENDTKAPKIVALALEAPVRKYTKSADERRGTDSSNTRDGDAQESTRHEHQGQDGIHTTPRTEIPEGSYGEAVVMEQEEAGTGEWPKRKDPVTGAYHHSWSNIGYPYDESLAVNEFEEDTHIAVDSPWVARLPRDIVGIKTRFPREIADDRVVDCQCRHNRVIEMFTAHGHTVAKVKMEDADVFGPGSPYSKCEVSKELERKLDEEVGTQPALEVEQWVAAHLVLAQAGQIGGRTKDYWRRARDMARQQLYTNKELEGKVRKQMQGDSPDAAFNNMIGMLHKLRFSAFGACTELARFFFGLLDPELLRKYTRVAAEVSKLGFVPFETGREEDPDWQRAFAALVPVGDFEGGDLVLRELGLQIRSPPGCAQLIRGRELRHSITSWKERRFVVINTTHDARAWRQLHGELEDYRQKDQVMLSEGGRIPERYVGVDEDGEDLSGPEEEFEALMPGEPGHLKLGLVRRRFNTLGEQSESDGRAIAAKRRK
ncbi:hypothetical protein DL766_003945 [Monosporascus sp. MC13-8B]|uniref:Uncharacterized protein n=1 Tax=Monosporascus cannonballus TaxID=155416 RepID=A0ABY0HI26_9PEZI|nr:hypothetical protein DL762_001011 [Monosporascus cannonballus]RYP00081.1 hypothetical protein DL763_001010 [Monosporascus cannonballus]RYP32529.1 hypothetical protein DL766_003945 [Monosporascus sp. MC13-8B]